MSGFSRKVDTPRKWAGGKPASSWRLLAYAKLNHAGRPKCLVKQTSVHEVRRVPLNIPCLYNENMKVLFNPDGHSEVGERRDSESPVR